MSTPVRGELPPGLPLEAFTLDIAGRDWSLLAVRDQDALLDAAEAFEHVPYGLLLWESAVALAEALARRQEELAGRTVLELGAGVGLAGIVAAGLGARVLQTDHEPATLALAARNACRNGVGGIRQAVADWRQWPLAERFDLVIGADVLYEPARHGDVAAILATAVVPGGRALLADPGRPQTPAFRQQLVERGWSVAVRRTRVADLVVPARMVQVTLLEASDYHAPRAPGVGRSGGG